MKIIPQLFALFFISSLLTPAATTFPLVAATQKDTTSTKVIFFDEFNDNTNKWGDQNNKKANSRIDGGFYYLTATGHAYGEAREVKIDIRKDFEIESRIKIVSGNSDHKNYYSMLFWGREAMSSYYFTFAKDGFVSVETCSSKNQSSCITQTGSLQKTTLNPDDFNVYTIRKTNRTYTFFVNGTQFYEMPFAPFFGNLIGFGAGRKVTLAVDYLKVSYL